MRTLAITIALLFPALADATTVRIHYDSKTPMLITSATGTVAAKRGAGKVWTYSWPDSAGDVTIKPSLGDKKPATGASYRLAAGSTVDIYPFFGPATGTIRILPEIASPQLKNSRKLRVYLPPSYDENPAKRYPVLYMHDGQNLFDAKSAAYGVEWGIDETVNRLIGEGAMDEIIVVGIDNSGARIAEYTPCCDPKFGGGQIEAYKAFVIDTVKPYIDGSLRTLPGKEHSAIMGSSLGGIASLVIAQSRPDVFSKAGAVSSSFWWKEMELVRKPLARVPVKFYLDAGGKNDGLEQTMQVRETMLKQGYKQGTDLLYYADPEGSHNEKSWAARVHRPLAWFFPWGSTRQ